MLIHLRVNDFILVRATELEFRPGLTVLTGETGAGKSMLIDALGLLTGDRAETDVVRHGTQKAELEAAFDITALPEVRTWLLEQDLEGDDGLIILRRTFEAGGRSRAFINGRSVTVSQLREAGEYLIDIHGQHAHQSLLKPGMQRELVDHYAGQAQTARTLKQVFRELAQVREAIAERHRSASALEAEIEQLRFNIQDAAPVLAAASNWEALQIEHARLTHAAGLLEAAGAAVHALTEADDAVVGQLNAVARSLQDMLSIDSALAEPAGLIESAAIQVKEAAYALRHYADRIDLDGEALEDVSRQIESVMNCARRHRVRPEELPAQHAQWSAQLAQLGGSEDDASLQQKEAALADQARQLAEQLSQARARAAELLSDRITTIMQSLAMPGGRFVVALKPESTLTAHGLEDIELLVASHASMEARSLAKVASGGELSRISLAIAVTTSQVQRVPVLIFDEVDVGIGGRVAELVGSHLKALGKEHQVLVITHLAQVAAQGDTHWQVFKSTDADGVSSDIRRLSEEARVEEIARMLGGATITGTTLAHAAEMLGQG